MKAAVLRGPSKLAHEDVPTPTLPVDGLILKVEACGICGSDLRALKHGLRFEQEWQILGHEIAGTVAEVGPNCETYDVGNRLAIAADVSCGECYYCKRALYNLCERWQLIGTHLAGGMAEYMALPASILKHGIVHRMPAELSMQGGALAEPAASVIAAQQRLQIEPGESVVIFGDGPIGALHIQVALARGAKPILFGHSRTRLAYIAQSGFGAWALFNSSEVDPVQTTRDLTEGRGADAAIVACASRAAQADAVNLLRKRGRMALYGGLPKTDPLTTLDSNRIHYDELSVIGTFSYHPSFHETALDLIDRELISEAKIISACYPLAAVEDAFRAAVERTALKVMLLPQM